MFRYTSWHFDAFSGTNLLTSRHNASSLFFCCFCVSKKLHRKYSWNWTKPKPVAQKFAEASREPKRSWSGATRCPHTRAAQPGSGPHPLCVRPPWTTFDDAPSPIKTPRWEKPKYPINFPEHIAIRHRRRSKDQKGPESLLGTLPERGIATEVLLHCHACLWSDEWVVYLGLWVHSSS
jgi:hypothetical protein